MTTLRTSWIASPARVSSPSRLITSADGWRIRQTRPRRCSRNCRSIRPRAISPGAVDYLLADPDVTSKSLGVIGFCVGGGFALQLAAQQDDRINAAVAFYGVGPAVPDQYRTVTAPIQGHYGEQDAMYPVDQAKAQERQIRDESAGSVEFFYYPAGHAFHNDKDRLGTYNPELATLAWSRAVAFLKTTPE